MQRPLAALLALPLAALPLPALADCAAEVAAFFAPGGMLDPFARPNRHEVTVLRHPDGSTSPVSDVFWDGPLTSRNCFEGGCVIVAGAQSWSGSGPDGPWTAGGDPYSGVDPATFVQATLDPLAASVAAPDCLRPVSLDGIALVAYRYTSKPEPNEFGSWWGGTYSLWADPASGRLVRMELADGIASWAPDPSPDVQITSVTYDDTIRVVAPD